MARMSALLVKRPPWGSAILLPAIIALAARSMVCRDALEWTGVDADDADSAAIVTSGVATSRLGVSCVRRQELLHPTETRAAPPLAPSKRRRWECVGTRSRCRNIRRFCAASASDGNVKFTTSGRRIAIASS